MTGLSRSAVLTSQGIAPRRLPNGAESRDLVFGRLATGEGVKLHQTVQPQGAPPNPAHSIDHSEFIVVQEGTLEVEHDGVAEMAGAGSVIYVALGTMHRVRNAGDGVARYTVISLGGDVKP